MLCHSGDPWSAGCRLGKAQAAVEAKILETDAGGELARLK